MAATFVPLDAVRRIRRRRRRDRSRTRWNGPGCRRRPAGAPRPPRGRSIAARARQLRASDRGLAAARGAGRDDTAAHAPRHEPRLAPTLVRARARPRASSGSAPQRERHGGARERAGGRAVPGTRVRRSARPGRWTERARPPSPRSAGASTACRSRSSWRRPVRGSSPLRRSWTGSATASTCSSPARPTCPPGSARSRATIEWSYQLLSPTEQRLFAQLGVFVGGCELEAAEAVCGDSVDVARDARRTRRSQPRAARGRLDHPHRDARDAARVRR